MLLEPNWRNYLNRKKDPCKNYKGHQWIRFASYLTTMSFIRPANGIVLSYYCTTFYYLFKIFFISYKYIQIITFSNFPYSPLIDFFLTLPYNSYNNYQLKPQVAHAQDGVTVSRYLLHFTKVTLFLIVSTLILLDCTKGGISMQNFYEQFINITISYMVSFVAGIQPVA